MVTVGGEHRKTTGLVQSDITGEGAVGCSNQDFLPVAGITATTNLQMLTLLIELSCSLQQPCTGICHGWTGR